MTLRMLAIAIILVVLVAAVAACAPMPLPPSEPITVIKEVDRIVQVKCEDKRGPAPDYPDTPDKLALIPSSDIFSLAQARVAGTILRDARLKESEAQIRACTGE